jgi:kumamolisin
MDFKPSNLIPVDLVMPEGASPEGINSYLPTYLTPPSIAAAYGIPNSTGYGVKIAIFSFGGGFQQSDLNKSFADLQTAGLISSNLTAPTIRTVLLDGQTGTYTGTGSDGENTVDIYCTACMAPLANISIYIGNYLSSMVAQAISDQVHICTMSWGGAEYTADETNLALLASNKIVFCASSGDYGSVVSEGSSSEAVVYPASSPNAIGVGGTHLYVTAQNVRSLETDDNGDSNFPSGWGGGGGISTTFSLPSWQTGLHYTPVTSGVTGSPTSLTMRGVPDISAPMSAYIYYQSGTLAAAGGTSLACPTLAGMFARILQLTGVKRSSVDWNTLAYAHQSVFYDITVGKDTGSISNGYAGTSGWDPVTGLGPPIGASLYALVRTGSIYPKLNYGFRNSTGAVYPRKNNGARAY